jgi:hypothetical protein
MNELDKTVDAVRTHGWKIVLLGVRSKQPLAGQSWQITSDPAVIRGHRGNIGLVCGQSNVAVLDFDNTEAMKVLFANLGPLTPWVLTGSGKIHCYVQLDEQLPAKMYHHGVVIGECQRGPMQQVVMPPSIHPLSGKPYVWGVDPRDPIPVLPDSWRDYLLAGNNGDRPKFITHGATAGLEDIEEERKWDGPTAEQILDRARTQPGARQRRNGIKFQCAGCRDEGHDKSRDNAIVYLDGKWGCAVGGKEHSRAIARQLGVMLLSPILNEDAKLKDKVVARRTIDDDPVFLHSFPDPDDKDPIFFNAKPLKVADKLIDGDNDE